MIYIRQVEATPDLKQEGLPSRQLKDLRRNGYGKKVVVGEQTLGGKAG
jgi:hypothetical protein